MSYFRICHKSLAPLRKPEFKYSYFIRYKLSFNRWTASLQQSYSFSTNKKVFKRQEETKTKYIFEHNSPESKNYISKTSNSLSKSKLKDEAHQFNIQIYGLGENTTSKDLISIFHHFGVIKEIKMEKIKHGSLSSQIAFRNRNAAVQAILNMNGKLISGRKVSVASAKYNGIPLFKISVYNLDFAVTEEEIKSHFQQFGDISHVSIVTNGQDSFASIFFFCEESAAQAIKKMNGEKFNENLITVKASKYSGLKFFKIVVENLPKSCTEEELKSKFESYGDIASVSIINNETKPRFGLVSFFNEKAAVKAIRNMHGHIFSGEVVSVTPAKESGLKLFKIFVDDLPLSSTETELRAMFKEFGDLARVSIKSLENHSTGSVYFFSSEGAVHAIKSLNRKNFKGSTLSVSAPNESDLKLFRIKIENLNKFCTKNELFSIFESLGEIAGISLRPTNTGNDKQFGYVRFFRDVAAIEAIRKMNGELLNGERIIVSAPRDSGITLFTIQAEKLNKPWTKDELISKFRCFGDIASIEVAPPKDGTANSLGIISYFDKKAAVDAIKHMHGYKCSDESISVTPTKGSSLKSFKIFVDNLDVSVEESELRAKFEQFGDIAEISIEKNIQGSSAYIYFLSGRGAASAIKNMNGKKFNEKCITVKASIDSGLKLYKIEVENLPKACTEEELSSKFQSYGDIASLRVVNDHPKPDESFGIVSFFTEEAAVEAIRNMHEHIFFGKVISVTPANESGLKLFKICVDHLPLSTTEIALRAKFKEFGDLAQVSIESVGNHSTGYVYFFSSEGAIHAIEKLNRKKFKGSTLSVSAPNDSGLKLFQIKIENLNKFCTKNELSSTFESFGEIAGISLITTNTGNDKQLGYVRFFRDVAAIEAIRKMNGELLNGERIIVSAPEDSGISVFTILAMKENKPWAENELRSSFQCFGDIACIGVAEAKTRISSSLGYISFLDKEAAVEAIKHMHGHKCLGDTISVTPTKSSGLKLFRICVENVGNSIGEAELRAKFEKFGDIARISIVRNKQGSLAHVYFFVEESAANAIRIMNGRSFNGNTITVSAPNASGLKLYQIMVSNLVGAVTNKELRSKFESFGGIMGVSISEDSSGKSLGYIRFFTKDAAVNAIKTMNGEFFNGQAITVSSAKQNGLKLYDIQVSNLPESCTERELKRKFQSCGAIARVGFIQDKENPEKSTGIVSFFTQEAAIDAIKKMNDAVFFDNTLSVLSVKDAEIYLLKIENLHHAITHELLHLFFRLFGDISQVNIELDSCGECSGTGYVQFVEKKTALEAIEKVDDLKYLVSNLRSMRVFPMFKS